jgi:hypothetical protein
MADYDSGWLKSDSETINVKHNLGTKDLFIYAMYQNGNSGISIVEPWKVQWSALDETSITVTLMGFRWDEQIRIIIWKLTNLYNNFIFGTTNPI